MSYNPKDWVSELHYLKEEMKRERERLKLMNQKKKRLEYGIYQHMVKNNLAVFEKIKINNIKPKDAIFRKNNQAKKSDAIEFFEKIGIENSKETYDEFLKTQKYIVEYEE
jgi:hypothetical protein